MNTKSFLTIGLFLTISSLSLFPVAAQVIENKVVLYNTVPVLAEIRDSAEIVRVIKTMPGYMSGYTLETQKFDEKQASSKEQASAVTGYSIISSDYYTLNFSLGVAVLEDEAVQQLDKLILHLIEHPSKNILLSVYNENMKDALYKNRINAIRTYLKVEGISLDRIQLNYLDGSSSPDSFRVNYIE